MMTMAPGIHPTGEPMGQRRIFVVEDHALMRRGMVDTLESSPGLTVCGTARDMVEALAAVAELLPDVVVTDLELKSSTGLDLIRALHRRTPALPVVAITMFDEENFERLARQAGAAEFAAKQDGPDRLVAAVRAALGGQPAPGRPALNP